MAYPVLAPNSTWFTQGGTTVKRASITEIEIKDSYTPDSSVTITSSWDASAAKDGSITCYVIGTKLIIAGNGSGGIYANEDSRFAFSDIEDVNLFNNVVTIIGFPYLDTQYANTLATMFYGCKNLTTIDVSCMNMSNVTSMFGMFMECSKINNIDVSNWDVSNISNISRVFYGCGSLTYLDVSKWDVSNATDLNMLFYSCSSLQELCLSGWRTPKNTSCNSMFFSCKQLRDVDISGFSFESFYGKYSLVSMFGSCESLQTIDFTGIRLPSDSEYTTSASGIFSNCKQLREVQGFNPSIVNNLLNAFNQCTLLQNLDTSNWDTSSCTNMSFMFYGCSSLGEIDVSNWDVSKVTNFDHFAAHANLKRKGIENWKTTSATNMNALFHNCAEEELDLSGWDVSKNQFFCQMFENSPNLKRIKGLDRWDTSAGLGFDGMFERCYKLEEVDLSSFNTTKAKNNVSGSTNGHKTATLQNMFLSCNNLKKVKLGPNFSINGDGTNTTAGNKLILPTPSTGYITGADGNWYAFNGDPYAPNAIPDRTADTYFASFPLCQNEDVIVKNGSLIDVAKAIKEKNGATAKYTPAQFGAAIRAL